MSWSNKRYLVLVLFILWQCGTPKKPNEEFLNRSPKIWTTYLHEIGVKDPDLSNHVFLISYATACLPCLKEVVWWNKNSTKKDNLGISIIIIEKYNSTFKRFLASNDIGIPAYRDSVGLILKYQLIPYPPVKLFFDEKNNIKVIARMGTNGNIAAFVEKIKDK